MANGQDILQVFLKTGVDIAGAAAKAAVDAALTTVDTAVNATRPGLLRQPRSIKQALDWLAALEEEGASGCVEVIKKAIPGFDDKEANATKLCEAARSVLVKINKNGDYTSAYIGDKWSELCTPGVGGKCCASTSGQGGCSGCKASSGGGTSCDGCCYDCPQIICARMFCLILPIVYYFLEFLSEKCKYEWKGQVADDKGTSDFKDFMKSCGFYTSKSHSISAYEIANWLEAIVEAMKPVKDALKKAFKDTKSHKSTLPTSSSANTATKEPSTIRDMMLWLQGLPYCPQFPELTKKIKERCEAVQTSGGNNNGVDCDKVLEKLLEALCRLPGIFVTVEGTSSYFMKDLMEGCLGYTNDQCFLYKKDGEELLKQFCEYTYKIHTQMRFLMTMCKTGKDHGGWERCNFGKGANGKGDKAQGAHTCSCNWSSTNGCSQPLKAFLTANSSSSGSNGAYQNGICMGFDSTKLTKRSPIGWDLYVIAKGLIDEIPTPTTASSQSQSTPRPLSLLTQYCVAIGNMDPSSLGDHFDVFRELANGMWSKIESGVEGNLQGITKDDNGDGTSDALYDALKELYTTEHRQHVNSADLASLTGCGQRGSSQSCTPFVASLSHGLYKYFIPKMEGQPQPPSQGPSKMIDWLYMKMSALYGKLKKLLEDMKNECQCCPKGEASDTCKGITQCPNCLPLMYKMGLVFGSAEQLSVKTCSELMEVMTKVLDSTTSKLCVVFKSIDENRFWPYLLFASHVVHGKYKDENGDIMNCYTEALGNEMYEKYLQEKKKEDEKEAETNKTARDGHLTCTGHSHQYDEPQVTPKDPTIVTLTLYFQGAYITQAVTITVPFHGPLYNPLVRLYPRNLKSIVDWLLRIGQTRLEQNTKEKGVTEMIQTFWPEIGECLNDENSKEVFKALIEKVMSLMGLENKGKTEVEKEVTEAYNKAKQNIQKKLNGGNGEEGFNNTFTSILTFKPKEYIDKVIDDFGNQVYDVNGSSDTKRSFECVAKAVSTCMSTALKEIQKLATENKKLKDTYGIQVPDVNNDIQAVANLTSIDQLKTLCDGFKDFHEVYKTVSGVFNDHLSTAQNGGKDHWSQINKCVEAFEKLGECVTELGALEKCNEVGKMTEAKEKLGELSDKLSTVIGKLSASEIQQFSDEVDKFIEKLDGVLKKEGEKGLAQALESASKPKGSSSTQQQFSDFLKSYVSELITKMKNNQIGDNNNTVCDIHLRVRNDLLQLSECLKVMCEVCGTGMKEFAKELRKCVDQGKGHLEKINTTKSKLDSLNKKLEEIKEASSQDSVKDKVTSAITTIEQLLKDKYIFQTQPIVSNFIQQDDVEKMTTYLKSLPDLIRDRYVLQKWKDGPETFCGVQSFNNGIVKRSGIEGIKEELQELMKDTFHDNPTNDITIHDFQVRALIYNFCHKEGMENIIAGLDVISGVKDVLLNGDVEWSDINSKKQQLLPLLTKLSDNAYLKYFATHLRDSIGYHTLSNTLGALEQVKESLSNGSTQPDGWNTFKELLKKDAIDDLSKRLSSLVAQLYNEYIFEYPPFDWTKYCHRLVPKAGARVARAAPQASPSTPSNTCDLCTYSMAYIFIGFVPQMYRLFKMLREMTKEDGYGREHKLQYDNNGTDAVKTTMSSLAGILSREGWRLKDGSDDDDEAFDLDASKKGDELYTKIDAIIGNMPTGDLLAQNGDTDSNSLMPLDKLFKAVMQHFKEERNKKRQQREQKERQAFEAEQQRTKSGLKFQAPPAPLPSTVRQVLFWLHELETKKEFYDAMLLHIETLCTAASRTVKSDISQDTILHVLKLSITQCLEVLATIEDPGRQNAQYYYELYTEEHYYAYPTVNIPLFFYTFVEKLMGAFLELNFVCVQCEFRATEGGWSECHIGKSEHSMEGQNCRCTKSHFKPSTVLPALVDGSVVCPRPLSAFLFSDQKNQLRIPGDVSQRLVYMSKGTMPCGFRLKNKAITDPATPGPALATPAPAPTPAPSSVTGSVLVEPLRKLVGGHVTGRHSGTTTNGLNTLSTVIYLRDLLRYTLCLAVRPPWSMSENMAFFYRVTESWKQKGHVAHKNTQLLQSIHAEITLFPGNFDGKLLTKAVERFAGVAENEKHDKTNSAASNMSHQFDLRTLMGCQETNTGTGTAGTAKCSPFMFPLSLDVYTHYDEKNSRAYLSWILNFAFGIYGQLRGLEEMIKGKECVRNASQSNPSDCPSLPMCPGVLTALYQSGSSFMDQKVLADVNKTNASSSNTTRKTCNDFHSVLSGLFNCNTASCTPLHNLIVQCEAFLWSIRLPFSLVQLALWSVAILFISYVFVVPLDHFKIKSHLFNRLKYTMHPSLLIADQQRRVSEVAYFSL